MFFQKTSEECSVKREEEKGENSEFRVQSGCLGLRRTKRGYREVHFPTFQKGVSQELMNSEFIIASVQLESGNRHHSENRTFGLGTERKMPGAGREREGAGQTRGEVK